METLLPSVERLVHEVGDYLLAAQATVSEEEKADGSPVTEADREAQRRLKEGLGRILPEAAFRGEEAAWAPWSEEWCWIVDPIDGTKMYASQERKWGVNVALAQGERVVLAVMALPALMTTYTCVEGGEVLKNGQPLRREAKEEIVGGYRKIAVVKEKGVAAAMPECSFRGDDPSVVLIADVLEGARAYVNVRLNTKVWDVAPGILFIEALGGKATLLDGQPIPLRSADPLLDSFVLSDGAIHEELCALMRSKGL